MCSGEERLAMCSWLFYSPFSFTRSRQHALLLANNGYCILGAHSTPLYWAHTLSLVCVASSWPPFRFLHRETEVRYPVQGHISNVQIESRLALHTKWEPLGMRTAMRKTLSNGTWGQEAKETQGCLPLWGYF